MFLLPMVLGVGWLVWGSVNTAIWVIKDPLHAGTVVRYMIVTNLLGFLICWGLCVTYDRLIPRMRWWKFALLAAILCLFGGVASGALTAWTLTWLGWTLPFQPGVSELLLDAGLHGGLVFGLFSSLYFTIDQWLKSVDQRERARSADELAQRAQLQMLRYQLNPHFLFNALNIIRASVLENPARARQIVTELAEFLRYSLESSGPDSTIGDELAVVENYLAVQRIRYEQALVVEMEVEERTRAQTVPCFLIHPLVENAVKHGMETSAAPLRVRLIVRRQDEELLIQVSNTGRLVPRAASSGTGTGLKNIAQRLELSFPQRHRFSLGEADGWVHAEIKLRGQGPSLRR